MRIDSVISFSCFFLYVNIFFLLWLKSILFNSCWHTWMTLRLNMCPEIPQCLQRAKMPIYFFYFFNFDPFTPKYTKHFLIFCLGLLKTNIHSYWLLSVLILISLCLILISLSLFTSILSQLWLHKQVSMVFLSDIDNHSKYSQVFKFPFVSNPKYRFFFAISNKVLCLNIKILKIMYVGWYRVSLPNKTMLLIIKNKDDNTFWRS